jgi:hypothetical protein
MDLDHGPHWLCAALIARTCLRDAVEIADFLPRFPADKPDDDGIAMARAESDTEPGTLLSLIGGPARIHHVIFIPDESVSEDDDISECDTGRYPLSYLYAVLGIKLPYGLSHHQLVVIGDPGRRSGRGQQC